MAYWSYVQLIKTIMSSTSTETERQSYTANATTTATDAIRQRILAGEWEDGSQLRQEALSRELGVSRVPVREALRQLEAEGLVTIIGNKGAVVSQLLLPEIIELLRVRVLLECNILLDAIPLQTCADIVEAEALLAGLETALNNKDISAWGLLNSQFHLVLYRASNRPQTLALIEKLHHRTNRYTRMQILLADFSDRKLLELSQLLELCRHKDAVFAAAFLRQHILNIEEALEVYFHAR